MTLISVNPEAPMTGGLEYQSAGSSAHAVYPGGPRFRPCTRPRRNGFEYPTIPSFSAQIALQYGRNDEEEPHVIRR